MCGIAGMVRFAGLAPDERLAGTRMARTLCHRGPDDDGLFTDGLASLGHRRLSIIDPAGGRQPASSEDGLIQVVFNGEIYNASALADGLRQRGHRLGSRCDGEVLPHLYEEYGASFVERLNGMFAIALWDARRRRLLLIRDRLGVKPLYWHDDGRRILFGSELKAILAAPGVARRVEPAALCDYLTFGHVPAPRTIFEGIRKLEPGSIATCRRSGTTVNRYWDIPWRPDDREPPAAGPRDLDRWSEEFASLLLDAVGLRLVADVPLGAFLSGGIDSSAIAAAMCRVSRNPVLTHTVGFDEGLFDERAAARKVAARLGTDHEEIVVRPDAARTARTLAAYFDEPFADASAIPTFHLARMTRRRVKVALSGDGGDELLAGYRRYRFDLGESAVRDRCPAWLRRAVFGVAGQLYPKGDWLPRPLRAKRTLENLARDEATAHARSVALAAGTLPDLLLRPELTAQAGGHDPFERLRDLYRRGPSDDRLNRLLYVDMKTLLPDDMLTKVDRASMAVGLEVRTPLLDYRLVELAARMPAALKLDGSQNKVVLRRALHAWLGADVAQRPKKGFDVPLDAWLRGPLRDFARDTLEAPDALYREWLDPRGVRCLLRDHQVGLRRNGAILWAVICLELSAQNYVAAPAEPAAPETPSASPCLVEAGA